MKQNSDPKMSYFIKLGQAMQVHPVALLALKWQQLRFNDSCTNNTKEPNLDLGGHDCHDKSAFITETIPDGSIIPAGATFTKTWVIQNVGNSIWQDRQLICTEQSVKTPCPVDIVDDIKLIPAQKTIDIPTVYPYQNIALSVDFVAPKVAGSYISYWKMTDSAGRLCFLNGHGLSVNIMVLTPNFAH